MDPITNLFLITYPFFLALLFLLIMLKPGRIAKGKAIELSIPLYFAAIPIKIERALFFYTLLSIALILSILYPFFRDYSFVFPTRVTFDVYYDVDELEKKLRELDSVLKTPLPVESNWKVKRSEKFSRIDELLGEKSSINKYFSYRDIGTYLSSKGEAEHGLVFHKQWQRYEITKVSGQLDHLLRLPNKNPVELETRYNLLNTSDNFVSVHLEDFLFGRTIVKPRMAQSLMYHSKRIFEVEFTGVTFVRFFPLSSLEFTVFCFVENGKYIPMSYAIYRK